MGKSSVFIAAGMAILGACSFYAGQKAREADRRATENSVAQLLSSQSRSLAQRVEEALARADQDANLANLRWRKKAKLQTFFTDTALAEPRSPKWVVVGGKRIRAAGLLDDALLEEALERHVEAKRRFTLHAAKGKYFLFVNGQVEGQPYAAAYVPEEFFAGLRSKEGIRDWLVLQDGTVIFHPLQRFVGASVANLRPVAAGIFDLGTEKSGVVTERYLGLEGKQAFGAWSRLPKHGLLAASEWPKDLHGAGGGAWWFSFAAFCGGAALFLFGWSWRARPAKRPAEETSMDFGRLDPDTVEYLARAKQSADQALAIAEERTQEAARARSERAAALANVRALEGRLALREQFTSRILPAATGKQVWSQAAELFAQHLPGMILVVYRYSPTSFSLVPESVSGRAGLSAAAAAYLAETRIFVGNTAFLDKLFGTEAFGRWNRARQNAMPGHEAEFRSFPIRMAGGGHGILLAIYDRRLNQEAALNESFSLLASLTLELGSFCDRLTALVQSSYAKGSSRPAVAGAPNQAGNRPRPNGEKLL